MLNSRRRNLVERLRREAFLVTPLGILINPFYIIRRGLCRTIAPLAATIEGDVLDFGCGSKPYESLFTSARTYVGVDLAVSGHSHRNSRVDHFYDGRNLPFPADCFDAVVCFEVLEHVFNLDEILAEIRRVLKPGGLLLVSLPFAWDEHEAPYDFARYTSFGIAHILRRNGYEPLRLIKTTSYVLAIGQLLIAYLAQYLVPKDSLAGRIFQLLVLCPLTLLFLLLDRILPRRHELFCNSVVLSRRVA